MGPIAEAFKDLIKHPIALSLFICTVIMVTYLQYVAPIQIKSQRDKDSVILDATVEVVRLKAEIRSLKAENRDELVDKLQFFVDTQEVEAWFTYYDSEDDTFKVFVMNDLYASKYNIRYPIRDKTSTELYLARPENKPEWNAMLLEYQVNDRLAWSKRKGCVEVMEWALEKGKKAERKKFRKCAMSSGTVVLIFGKLARNQLKAG